MTLISFNINGIRARLHQLQTVIDKYQPALIGLQETKVHDPEFPEPVSYTHLTLPTICSV